MLEGEIQRGGVLVRVPKLLGSTLRRTGLEGELSKAFLSKGKSAKWQWIKT